MTVDQLQTLLEPLFPGLMGVRLLEVAPDRVVAEMEVRPDLCTSGGILHGGALMACADTIGAVVTFLGLPEGAGTATITSSTQLMRAASGDVTARSKALHRGRTTVTVQTTLYDADERIVAQTTQVQAVLAPRG